MSGDASPGDSAGGSHPGTDGAGADALPGDTGADGGSSPDARVVDGGGPPASKPDGGAADGGSGTEGGSIGEGEGGALQAFSQCRFHFGTIDSIEQSAGASLVSQLDTFTSGWLGQNDIAPDGVTKAVCKEMAASGALAGQTPALVSYIIAFAARRHACLSDCNANNAVGQNGCTAQNSSDLCTGGAAYIRNNIDFILGIYASYAQALASCYGTARPLIWKMEPDYYQYHSTNQGGSPLSLTEAAGYMTQMMTTVRRYMPNALFSLDISPWIPNNGSGWYPAFDLSLVSFISTSGGDTSASTAQIRTNNSMTWAGVHAVTGKPILADTGYGANGASSGPDPAWDEPTNINARIADGVIAITQYNPNAASWGATIAANRAQIAAVPCY